MKVKTCTLKKCFIVVAVVALIVSSSSYAKELLCKGKHNYNSQVIYKEYNGPETSTEVWKPVSTDENGFTTYQLYIRYQWCIFADKYGICVCGKGTWISKKEHVGYDYREEERNVYRTILG